MARAVREAAEHARRQEEARRLAEEEAIAARLEVGMLRKQLEAMDDRVKAKDRLKQRAKEGAVSAVLHLILDMVHEAVRMPTPPQPVFDAFAEPAPVGGVAYDAEAEEEEKEEEEGEEVILTCGTHDATCR